MAKYIKQELPDLHKTGEKKAYYRLKTERNIDFHRMHLQPQFGYQQGRSNTGSRACHRCFGRATGSGVFRNY